MGNTSHTGAHDNQMLTTRNATSRTPHACTAGGHYVRGDSDVPPYDVSEIIPNSSHYTHCTGSSYASMFGTHDTSGLRFGWENWTWVVPGEPECSRATPANAWCDAFAGRHVLMVGDSLSEAMFLSLLFWLHLAEEPRHEKSVGDRAPAPRISRLHLEAFDGRKRPVCNGRGAVAFVRNDLACHEGWAIECKRKQNARPFAHLAPHFDTIVLNAGLHMLPTPRVEAHTRALIRWLNSTRPHVDVIWRTGVPGHVGCKSAAAPLPTAYVSPRGPKLDPFGWAHVGPHDALRASLFDSLLGGGKKVRYLDAAVISNVRADRHLLFREKNNHSNKPDHYRYDCLHYCLPGPPDDWNRALRAMLLERTPS